MKTAITTAVLAVTFVGSLGFSKTLRCQGSDVNSGEAFRVTVALSGTEAAVSVRSGGYANSWSADDLQVQKRKGETTIVASAGDRGEYYLRMQVKGNLSSLDYAENDSGWEMSLKPDFKSLKCK